jgi:hypothetical protein
MAKKTAAQEKENFSSRGRRGWLIFREVKGKIVEQVEVDPDAQAIVIVFQDQTVLSFDLDSHHSVFPELLEHTSGDLRPIKRWKPVESSPTITNWMSTRLSLGNKLKQKKRRK